ncbi:dynein light chain 4, axonemal-like [Hordeum vulgare]|nr:dynein light chain 4, axonemal-like [Hordeum vulgare]
MDPAQEELERRSRYLSSLVRRTRLHDPPQPEPEPEPELKVERKPAAEPSGGEGKAVKAEAKDNREAKVKGGAASGEGRKVAVRVRAADMPLPLQRRAIWIAREVVLSTPRLESKRLALALKKVLPPFPFEFVVLLSDIDRSAVLVESLIAANDHGMKEFDTTYGPAWHCIVGTSFGSYVTHSLGGFLYFSVDKAYILLFRTAVEPLSHP